MASVIGVIDCPACGAPIEVFQTGCRLEDGPDGPEVRLSIEPAPHHCGPHDGGEPVPLPIAA